MQLHMAKCLSLHLTNNTVHGNLPALGQVTQFHTLRCRNTPHHTTPKAVTACKRKPRRCQHDHTHGADRDTAGLLKKQVPRASVMRTETLRVEARRDHCTLARHPLGHGVTACYTFAMLEQTRLRCTCWNVLLDVESRVFRIRRRLKLSHVSTCMRLTATQRY